MISVCLATCNGEKYILEQINSILLQIDINDELLISDDNSTDNTLNILKKIDDCRIKIFQNNFSNVIKNFEFLLNMAVGDVIFLSDQDDIWHKEKISTHLNFYKTFYKPLLVFSDVQLIDERGKFIDKLFFKNKFQKSFLKNIFRNQFIGCSISFNKQAKDIVLPFPNKIPMHDWWIGCVMLLYGEVVFLDNKLTFYRRHQNNFTGNMTNSLLLMLKWRLILLFQISILNINKKRK
jgi:glycosyltransferase involved in cell wall biosynthesis